MFCAQSTARDYIRAEGDADIVVTIEILSVQADEVSFTMSEASSEVPDCLSKNLQMDLWASNYWIFYLQSTQMVVSGGTNLIQSQV